MKDARVASWYRHTLNRGMRCFLRIILIAACGLLAMLAWLRPESVSLERGMHGVVLDQHASRAFGQVPKADGPGSNSTISHPLQDKGGIHVERHDRPSWFHDVHRHRLDGRVQQKPEAAYNGSSRPQPLQQQQQQRPQQQQEQQQRPQLRQGKPRQNWSTRPAAVVSVSGSDASANRVPLPDRLAKIESLVFSEFVPIRNSPPKGGENISAQQAAEAVNSYAELLKLRPPDECAASPTPPNLEHWIPCPLRSSH